MPDDRKPNTNAVASAAASSRPRVERPSMRHAEIEAIRRERGRSMLFFITDRCPVGCEHCSVDSRADSPTVADFSLFEDIVEWMCDAPELEVIGVSGGEPFVERRGLSLATERLAAAGKRVVIFTSGVWAGGGAAAPWIGETIARCCCIYLSTDAFHARAVGDEHFVRAARTIASAGVWMVVQVLDDGGSLARAAGLLRLTFGERWAELAEINVVSPVNTGRGAEVFTRLARTRGDAFGSCSLARSPMVRYDGVVTGCCNESVLMGGGPSRLRRRVDAREGLMAAVRAFHDDPLLRVIGGAGLGALTIHPRFADLSEERFASNCEMCWKALDRAPLLDGTDRLMRALGTLEADR